MDGSMLEIFSFVLKTMLIPRPMIMMLPTPETMEMVSAVMMGLIKFARTEMPPWYIKTEKLDNSTPKPMVELKITAMIPSRMDFA